ncbi:MAG TPA: DUF6223 family protein [Cyclobacteriaceae bacterium]
MNKIILALAIAFALLATPTKLFSKAVPSENKIEITDSTTTPGKATGYVKDITTARAISLVEGLLGLISIVMGWRAKTRSAKTGGRIALVLGLLAVTLSIAHLTFTAGAVFGSGSGKAGAILALLFGLSGSVFGAMVLRSRFSK